MFNSFCADVVSCRFWLIISVVLLLPLASVEFADAGAKKHYLTGKCTDSCSPNHYCLIVPNCKPRLYSDHNLLGVKTGDEDIEFITIDPLKDTEGEPLSRYYYLGGRWGPDAHLNIRAKFPPRLRGKIAYVKMKHNGRVKRIEHRAPYTFFGDKKRANGSRNYISWWGVCQGISYFEAIAYNKHNREIGRAGQYVNLYQE